MANTTTTAETKNHSGENNNNVESRPEHPSDNNWDERGPTKDITAEQNNPEAELLQSLSDEITNKYPDADVQELPGYDLETINRLNEQNEWEVIYMDGKVTNLTQQILATGDMEIIDRHNKTISNILTGVTFLETRHLDEGVFLDGSLLKDSLNNPGERIIYTRSLKMSPAEFKESEMYDEDDGTILEYIEDALQTPSLDVEFENKSAWFNNTEQPRPQTAEVAAVKNYTVDEEIFKLQETTESKNGSDKTLAEEIKSPPKEFKETWPIITESKASQQIKKNENKPRHEYIYTPITAPRPQQKKTTSPIGQIISIKTMGKYSIQKQEKNITGAVMPVKEEKSELTPKRQAEKNTTASPVYKIQENTAPQIAETPRRETPKFAQSGEAAISPPINLPEQKNRLIAQELKNTPSEEKENPVIIMAGVQKEAVAETPIKPETATLSQNDTPKPRHPIQQSNNELHQNRITEIANEPSPHKTTEAQTPKPDIVDEPKTAETIFIKQEPKKPIVVQPGKVEMIQEVPRVTGQHGQEEIKTSSTEPKILERPVIDMSIKPAIKTPINDKIISAKLEPATMPAIQPKLARPIISLRKAENSAIKNNPAIRQSNHKAHYNRVTKARQIMRGKYTNEGATRNIAPELRQLEKTKSGRLHPQRPMGYKKISERAGRKYGMTGSRPPGGDSDQSWAIANIATDSYSIATIAR